MAAKTSAGIPAISAYCFNLSPPSETALFIPAKVLITEPRAASGAIPREESAVDRPMMSGVENLAIFAVVAISFVTDKICASVATAFTPA